MVEKAPIWMKTITHQGIDLTFFFSHHDRTIRFGRIVKTPLLGIS